MTFEAECRSSSSLALLLWLWAIAATSPAFAVDTTATRPANGGGDDDRVDLPSFGISVPIPKGFARTTDSSSSVLMLVPAERVAAKDPGELVYINAGLKRELKLADLADRVARSDGLTIVRKDARWGDRGDAADVSGPARPPTQGKMTLRRCVVAERGQYLFTLVHLADAEHVGHDDDVDELVRGTRWSDPTPAGKGVKLRRPSIQLSNGMRVSIPDPFRPDPEDKGARRESFTFSAMDLPSGRRAAFLQVISLPGDVPRTLEAAKNEAKENLAEVLNLKEPFRWDETKASDSFAITLPMKSGPGWAQVLVARTDEKTTTVFTLGCFAAEQPKAAEGMEEALPLIRQSIEMSLKQDRRP